MQPDWEYNRDCVRKSNRLHPVISVFTLCLLAIGSVTVSDLSSKRLLRSHHQLREVTQHTRHITCLQPDAKHSEQDPLAHTLLHTIDSVYCWQVFKMQFVVLHQIRSCGAIANLWKELQRKFPKESHMD